MALLSHIFPKGRIIINPRLILTNPFSPDSKKPYFAKKIWIQAVSLIRRQIGLNWLLVSFLLLPISVSAGLFNIFKTDSRTEILSSGSQSLQNMALLASNASPSPNQNNLSIENDALVPADGPLGSSVGPSYHRSTPDQISIYVVHKGDTLSEIAKMFGVSVNTIKWGNDLVSNTLKEGQSLVILPISGVQHTVVKGDTLDSLAKKYKADKEEILAFNDLVADKKLEVGSVLIIPDGEMSTVSNSQSSIVKSSSGLKEYKGYYLRPVVGGVKTQGIHGYNGIDLAASLGTPILAAADGDVIVSRSGGWNGGYGNYVVIRHDNGTQTLYAHNSQNKVAVGDKVKQGEVIALMGATGKATGIHLHFEIRGAKNPF